MHLHKSTHPNEEHFPFTPVFTKKDHAIAQFPSSSLDVIEQATNTDSDSWIQILNIESMLTVQEK